MSRRRAGPATSRSASVRLLRRRGDGADANAGPRCRAWAGRADRRRRHRFWLDAETRRARPALPPDATAPPPGAPIWVTNRATGAGPAAWRQMREPQPRYTELADGVPKPARSAHRQEDHQGDYRLQPDRRRRPHHGRPVRRQGQLGAAADAGHPAPARADRLLARSPSTSTPATRTSSTASSPRPARSAAGSTASSTRRSAT